MNLRSLQENVAEAIQAFDSVAEFIEERTGDDSVMETIRPANYGEILRRIEFAGNSVTVAQLTVYKEQSVAPATPEGGTVNLITGQLIAPEGWSFTPPASGTVWASTALGNDGVNQTGWCLPYLNTGSTGEDGVSLLSIEQTTESEEDGGLNIITATMSDGQRSTFRLRNGSAGTAGADGKDGEQGPQGEKGDPGKDGADGMDGSVYEYVYFRGLTLNDKPANIPSGEGNNQDDYEPTYTKTVIVNGNSVVLKGTDKAQGVDETYKFEWRSERKKSDADTGGDFTTPILGAKYGEKGKDGDGIQYIFKCTSEYKRPIDKITPDDYLTNPKYQGLESEEYVPTELGGSDDPVDVDANTPYCGVAVRKYRNDKGGAYSTPTLGAKYGKDGQGSDGTDGYRFEFIYKRVANDTVVVEKPSNEQTDFYVPTSEGGTGDPQGVTDDLQAEYVCQREKIDGIGQDGSAPSLGAMYGKIGRDGNGVEYIYCITKNETIIPTLPSMDPNKDETGHSFPLKSGEFSGTDDPISVTEDMSVCGVSVRRQYYNGDKQVWGDLSTPSVGAKYGKDGADGSGGRTVFVYTGSKLHDPSPAITAPQGGKGNVETNTVTGVTGANGYIWTMMPPAKSDEVKYIWQSVGNFDADGNLIDEGSQPFCITGEDGRDGTDGVSKEFIYRLISNKDNFDQLKAGLADGSHKLENTPTGVVPTTKDSICESEGTDEPSGINGETYLVEVVCSRKARLDETGVFAGGDEWSAPTIGAMGGEDGNDGPGVEYIFRVTGPNKTSVELYNEFKAHNIFNHADYQKDGFYPGEEGGIDLDWTDEPQDVDEKQPLEGVSIRKGAVNQETGKVTWGEFSEPKIWGKYSEDGYSYKTSYVFARNNEYPGDPIGGDYTHSYPTVDGSPNGERNPIGFDSVPEGDAIIWMSNRTFRSDNDLSVDNDGSTPVKMSDTANFQVEFTAEDLSKRSGYKPAKFTGDEDTGRAGEATKGVVWADDVPGALYMATATCKNGVGNDWAVVKVKGEQGDKGADGTSVKIEGKFETVAELQSEGATYIANPSAYSNGKFVLPLEQGDGYIVEEDGCLGVYDGNGTAFNEAGLNAGKIQGDSAMIYIRFSDNADGSGMYPEGTIGKHIGVATTSGEVDLNYLSDYRNYKGAPWSGDDGFGYEQVFIATKTNSAPAIPSQSVKEVDGIPTNGSDKPISVSETNPFVWYVTRKTEGDWAGKGDKDNPGYAALYSRYSYDGEAFHLELTNDQGILPLENGVIDPDFNISSVTTTMVLYAGDEVVDNGVSYKIGDTNAAALSGNVVTLKAGAANVSEIECTATYKKVDYKKTFHIIKTANAFDIITDKIVLERDSETGDLVKSDQLLTVGPKRWNGQKGSIANGKILFIKCYHVDGTEDSPESKLIQNSESVSLDLSDEINLSKVRLYFTEQNTENGTEICFEEVGVIANGTKGDRGPEGPQGPQGPAGTFSEEEKQALLQQAQDNFDTAAEQLSKDIASAETRLRAAEAALQAATEGIGDLEAAQAEYAAALAAKATKEDVQKAISSFSNSYFDDSGKLVSTALNEPDVYRLSLAALGKSAEEVPGFDPDTDIAADSVFAQTVNGVVGTFVEARIGTLKVDDLKGDRISGRTFQSNNEVDIPYGPSFDGFDENGNYTSTGQNDGATFGPSGQLGRTGTGYLANGNIYWDASGNVTLGENVTFTGTDSNTPPSSGNGLSEDDVETIATRITNSTIETSKIKVNQLKGDRISGKTFESSVRGEMYVPQVDRFDEEGNFSYIDYPDGVNSDIPMGQLSRTGAGHLAGGNIRWDAAGNVTFGENVEMNGSGEAAQEVTRITQEAISTAKINASNINAGTLSADRIDLDRLSVKKLNTKPDQGSRIEIVNNQLSVVDADKIVRLTMSDTKRGYTEFANALDSKTRSLTGYSIAGLPFYIKSGPPENIPFELVACTENLGYLYKGDKITLGATLQYLDIYSEEMTFEFIFGAKIEILKDGAVVTTLTSNAENAGDPVYCSPDAHGSINITLASKTYTIPEHGNYSWRMVYVGSWCCNSTGGNIDHPHGDYENEVAKVTGTLFAQELSLTNIFADGFEVNNPNGGLFVNTEGVLVKQGNVKFAIYNNNIFMAFGEGQSLRAVTPQTITVNGSKMNVLTIADAID